MIKFIQDGIFLWGIFQFMDIVVSLSTIAIMAISRAIKSARKKEWTNG